MIRRHAIHYIIESPKGRSKLIFLRDSLLTLFVWVMYFYFMRDFFLFLGDLALWALHGFGDTADYPSLKIFATIANYLLVSALTTVAFISWSVYNLLRFRNKTRRKFRLPVSPRELGTAYHAAPKSVSEWQKARIMVMHHDAQGHLTDVMIQE